MKNHLFIGLLLCIFLLSSCSSSYNGPYASTPLVSKEDVTKQIETDNKLINDSKTPLLTQVKAKADIKYFQMLFNCYVNYEKIVKNTNGKKYTLTAASINEFIKTNKYASDLRLIEPDQGKWPSIFLGNLARYFASMGFGVYTDPSLDQENITITW